MAMSVLTVLDRYVLWITPPLMCGSAVLLGLLIRNVVRLGTEARILSVPLVEQQTIEFREARRVVLSEEGPRFSSRFAGLGYQLSTEYGMPVEGRKARFSATTTGLTTARREVRVYEIPHPGRYVLRVEKLGAAQEGDAKHRLVFARPHLAQAIGYVIGMILSGGIFIGSLVFFVLRVTGKG